MNAKPIVNIADVPLRDGGNGKQFAAKLGRIGGLIGAGGNSRVLTSHVPSASCVFSRKRKPS